MTDTAKIAGLNKTEHTGLTPHVAHEFVRLGNSRVAIVELSSTEDTKDLDNNHTVKLELGFIETVPAGSPLDDLLRDLAQALYRERDTQRPIDGVDDTQPTVADILERASLLART